MTKARYRVTVSRVNEGMNDAPYVTMTANRIILDADGRLAIEGEGGGHSFSSNLWDGVEIERLSPEAPSA